MASISITKERNGQFTVVERGQPDEVFNTEREATFERDVRTLAQDPTLGAQKTSRGITKRDTDQHYNFGSSAKQSDARAILAK